MSDCLLAFDLGTTGNKAVLVDASSGAVLGAALARYGTNYTSDGGAEQDPLDWWTSLIETCIELRRRYPELFSQVIGIGCGGMMNGLVAVDAAGEAVGSAIIHADVRSSQQVRQLESQFGVDSIFARTLNRPDVHLTLPKAMWAAQNRSDQMRRAVSIVQCNDYLVGRLTGTFPVTDPSNASLTGGYDPVRRVWVEDLWSAAGVDIRLLPAVHRSTEVIGRVASGAATATGLAEGIPVVVGGGDGACASAGSGSANGEAYVYLGGTSWVGFVTNTPLRDSRLSSYCCLDERITCFGTVQAAGSSMEWVRGIIGDGSMDFEMLDQMASCVPVGARKLIFLPYLQGERAPIWDDTARGVFFGLATHHGPAELYRAALEGVCFALSSIVKVFGEMGQDIAALRVLGGGAGSSFWMQMLSSILGRPLQPVADISSATSLGAAMAAGVGVGCWASVEQAAALVSLDESILPDESQARAYSPLADYFLTLYPAFRDRFAALAALEINK